MVWSNMALRSPRGKTPLDRYQNNLNHREYRCLECGYEDEAEGWRAETDGGSIYYRRECPQCESQQTRRFTLSK